MKAGLMPCDTRECWIDVSSCCTCATDGLDAASTLVIFSRRLLSLGVRVSGIGICVPATHRQSRFVPIGVHLGCLPLGRHMRLLQIPTRPFYADLTCMALHAFVVLKRPGTGWVA